MLKIENLKGKLNPKLIKSRESGNGQKLSYVPGYTIESILNDLSDYIWSRRTLELTQLFVRNYKNSKGNDMTEVAYSAKVEISVQIKDPNNDTIYDIVKQGCGFGNGQSGINNPSAAYELAIKEAETDAFKRAAKSLGEQFGLELYDKDLDFVRSYEKAKITDDKFNDALDSVLQSDDEDQITQIVKSYDGNYKNDLRESAITHILDMRQRGKESK